MARKQRDYSNLRETEKVWDAVKVQRAQVKDYSLIHIIFIGWQLSEQEMLRRLIHISVGGEEYIGRGPEVVEFINDLADEADDDGWFPEHEGSFFGKKGKLTISTKGVNKESLRDHLAFLTVGKNTALVDLEELLKAIRYA